MKAVTYNYRYLPSSSVVYTVTMDVQRDVKRPLYGRKTSFLTENVEIKNRNETRSVVVGFANNVMVSYRLPLILQEYRNASELRELEMIPDAMWPDNYSVHMTKMEALIDHCRHMSMPLIVYMNGFCAVEDKREYCDVFFYSPEQTINMQQIR